jgi:hypothetical protein
MRQLTKRCDICGKQTEDIVGKILFTPAHHSLYTHTADVGVCCQKKLLNGFQWRERMSAEEYNESRRVG